ncbi:MAG: JAB domain-containing protein [Clostridia bacterium]
METLFNSNLSDVRLSDSAALYKTLNKHVDTDMSFNELVESLTPAKKQLVLSAIELYKRDQHKDITSIHSCNDAYLLFKEVMAGIPHEEFWCLYLNRSNTVLKRVRLSMGAISETTVDIRILLKNALLLNATSIIIGHNHPSGNRLPSVNDNNFTKKLKEAASVMNISLLDHIIVPNNDPRYYSYNNQGIL